MPILDNGKILLVRQYRNALDRYTLELPAGKVDAKDEPRRICAFRELREETGYRVDSPDELEFLIRIDTMVAFGDEEIDIFVAKNLKKGEEYDFSFEFDANLGVGSFSVTIALHDSDNHLQNNYEWRDNAIIFNVVNFSKPDFVGLAYLEPSLEIKRING